MSEQSELKTIPDPPPGLPFLGNMREIQQKEILQLGADIRANYGDITITLKKRGKYLIVLDGLAVFLAGNKP